MVKNHCHPSRPSPRRTRSGWRTSARPELALEAQEHFGADDGNSLRATGMCCSRRTPRRRRHSARPQEAHQTKTRRPRNATAPESIVTARALARSILSRIAEASTGVGWRRLMKLVPKLALIDDLLAGRCGKVAPGDVLPSTGFHRRVHSRRDRLGDPPCWDRHPRDGPGAALPSRGDGQGDHRHPARPGARGLPARSAPALSAAGAQSRVLVVPRR